ncbi:MULTISPECIES: hypothetical protein [Methylosinus]|uniref:Uncharacterized protein n=1 Tax=Methylosinus trichosporium (strain ATCC 35070 / NCIMB 11131 / UNIQEM 75 / OB3b) TaxID=595536 RepID=A0A2D2CVN3_METT3|nr:MULTISPECIES: hypothetical protein [Methylosinus]ATQ66716.1 hypothetical protein CQW49_01500 [Methylosinus trichosporium OB3b]OBS53384.1 hypothetical protein A8B73_06310 [Methylosinus sp. 3S-1]
MSDVRLIAVWRDDPTVARLTVDLRIEGGRVVGGWDVFGAFDLDGAERRPFILRKDGRIELDARVAERWRTDLRGVEIRIGARFRVLWNESDGADYEVVKLAELGTKTSG